MRVPMAAIPSRPLSDASEAEDATMWLDTLRKLFGMQPRSKRKLRCRPAPARRTPRLRLEHLEDRITPTAVVTTDLPDYAPGATALIDASGFESGETIELQVLH